MVKNRAGSVGGDILKRFSVVFDYKNEKLYMKKNSRFGEAFTYNKSGIEIKSTGLQWVKEKVSLGTVSISGGITFNQNEENVSNGIKYKFDLKPIYEIVNIRKNSSAELSGLQVGDKIISINRLLAYHYSLEKLNELFKAEDEKMFYIEVERKGEVLKFTFQLHDVFK
jgi:membrane-associated protease RseP (regulator of RpoE activity)